MNTHNISQTLRAGTELATADRALILIHGRGSDGHDLLGLAQHLDIPANTALLAPQATGRSWYPNRFLVDPRLNEPCLSSALALIDALVGEAKEAGIAPGEIGLIGFSQGACLALEYASRQTEQFQFVGGLSGALIGPLDTLRPEITMSGTPVLLGCAERDAHIPLEHVEASATSLRAGGAHVTKQIFPGSAHSVFPEEIAWLNHHLVNT